MPEITMTPELRNQLAGYLPFSNDATTKYTPDFFLQKKKVWNEEKKEFDDGEIIIPEKFQPKLEVRCFNKGEYDKAKKLIIEETQDKEEKRKSELFEQTKELARKVVMGWSDYWDIGKMEEIKFKADPEGGCDKDLWAKMPDWMFYSIRTFVYRLSGLTPGEILSLK